jgi:hypothetical protein
MQDIAAIQQAGKQAGANAFVTTEKDAQNFSALDFGEAPVYISVIDLEMSPEADFRNILDQTLAARSRPAA